MMRRLGPTLNGLLSLAKIKKSEFAAKCGLSPSAVTKILQGESYSNEMAGRIISGFDDPQQQAELLAAHLEDIKASTGIVNDKVVIHILEERPDSYNIPYHLKYIFRILANECQQDADLEASLRYLASRFEDFNREELKVAEDRPESL